MGENFGGGLMFGIGRVILVGLMVQGRMSLGAEKLLTGQETSSVRSFWAVQSSWSE